MSGRAIVRSKIYAKYNNSGTGTSPSASTGYWGTFWDNTDQTGNTTSATPVSLGVADPNNNAVSISGGNQIIVTNSGIYNIQYSLQFENSDSTGSAHHDANVWIRINGSDLTDSASMFEVPEKHGLYNGKLDAVSNHVLKLNAGDAIQIMWQPEIIDISLQYNPPGTTPTTPDTPSAYVTVTQVAGVVSGGGGGGSGTVTSVGLSAPPAFTVSGSPVTTSGTLTFVGAGTVTQYIDGTGNLAPFIIVDTWANILALKSANQLIPGIKYRINDVYTNWEVIIMADSVNTFGADAEIIYVGSVKYHGQYYFDNNIITRVVDTVNNNIVEAESDTTMDNIVTFFVWNTSAWANNIVTGNSLLIYNTGNVSYFKNNYIGENSVLTITSDSNRLYILNNYISAGIIEIITYSFSNDIYLTGNYIHSPKDINVSYAYQYSSGLSFNISPQNDLLYIDNNHIENSYFEINQCAGFNTISNNYLKSSWNTVDNLAAFYIYNTSYYDSIGSIQHNVIENDSFVHITNCQINNFDGNRLYGYDNLGNSFVSGLKGSMIKLEITISTYFTNNTLINNSSIYSHNLTNYKFEQNYFKNANLFIDYEVTGTISTFSFNTIEYTSAINNVLRLSDSIQDAYITANIFSGNNLYNFFLNGGEKARYYLQNFKDNEMLFTILNYIDESTTTDFLNNYSNNNSLTLNKSTVTNFNYNNIEDCNTENRYFVIQNSTIDNFNYNDIKNSLYYIFNLTNPYHNSNNVLNSDLVFYEGSVASDYIYSFSDNIITESNLTFFFYDISNNFSYDYNKIHQTFFYAYINNGVPTNCLMNSCSIYNANDFFPFGITSRSSNNGISYTNKSYTRGTRSTFDVTLDIGDLFSLNTLAFDPDISGFAGIYIPTNITAPIDVYTFLTAPISHPFYIFGDKDYYIFYYSYASSITGNLKVPDITAVKIENEFSFAEFNLFENTNLFWTMINYQNVY